MVIMLITQSEPPNPVTAFFGYLAMGCLALGLVFQFLLWLVNRWPERRAPRRRRESPRSSRRRESPQASRPSGRPPQQATTRARVLSQEEWRSHWKARERRWQAKLAAFNQAWHEREIAMVAERDQYEAQCAQDAARIAQDAARIAQLEAQLKAAAATRLPMITVATLAASTTVLLVGSRGSGKTTLLQAIVRERSGVLCVFDPHTAQDKWPNRAMVYGGGEHFAEVYDRLRWLTQLMRRRAEEQQAKQEGTCRFPRIDIVADEWSGIVSDTPFPRGEKSPGEMVMALLLRGRKFQIGFVAGAHNDTVASIGAKGDKDAFLTSFDWIVYMGAFVSDKLRSYPHIMNEIPWQRTADGIQIPTVVVAYQPATRSLALLDLRNLPRATRNHSDLRTYPDLDLDEGGSTGAPSPPDDLLPQSSSPSMVIRVEERQRILAAILDEVHAAQQDGRVPSKGRVCRAVFGRDGGTARQKVVAVIEESAFADSFGKPIDGPALATA